MNTWRKLLAQKVYSNAGYSAGRGETYAIEYNVGLYYVDLSPEKMHKLAVEQGYTDLPLIDFPWDQNSEFEYAQQDAARSIYDGDDCTYRSYGVAESIRFGLPYFTEYHKRKIKRRTNECAYYPAKVSGWIIESPYANVEFEVEFGLYGRGGKHLCVTEFEGRKLNMTSDTLADDILNSEDHGYNGYTNKWCQKLLAMMHVWEEYFTPHKASAEIEFQAAYSFSHLLIEAHGEIEKKAKQEADIELAYANI